jgi:negative regulator of sigma E activity
MNALNTRGQACRATRSVSAYADGELEPNRAVEVEEHVSTCRSCREELELIRAMRRSLRRSTARPASASFAERMRLVALAEQSEENEAVAGVSAAQVAPPEVAAAKPPHVETNVAQRIRARATWGVTMAVAAAAGFVLAFFGSRSDLMRIPALKSASLLDSLPSNVKSATPTQSASSTLDERRVGFEALIDRLVSFHANPPPAEVDDLDAAVHRFEPLVGVHMRGSTLRGPLSGARFNGARIWDLDVRPATNMRYGAELRYSVPGHRITIYVFDPNVVPIRVTRLKPRVVRTNQNPVYVGTVRGFSVAAGERSGIGYAVASDFDDEKSAQLVANF